MRRPVRLPALIAHRGASREAPENTLAAFRRAVAIFSGTGIDGGVELDAMLAAPADPPRQRHPRPVVVHHDDRLGRTSDGRGAVGETSLAVLARLDAGSWHAARFAGESVPTLADAVAVIAGAGLQLVCEVKPAPGLERETAAACVDLLRARWPRRAALPLVASFSVESLDEARRRAPELPRALNLERLAPGWAAEARRLACVSVHVDHRALDGRGLAAIRRAGLHAVAWTVNSPATALRLYRAGVAAVISDDPRRLVSAVRLPRGPGALVTARRAAPGRRRP